MRTSTFAFGFLLVGFFAGLAWRGTRSSEAVYNGRPLSAWLRSHDLTRRSRDTEQSPERLKEEETIRQIGTNGIPIMLRMLQAKDSVLEVKLFELLEKQHFIKIHHIPDWELQDLAGDEFLMLGPAAKDAVPALIAIYDRNISEGSQLKTALALGGIGPAAKQAIPSLLRGAANTNDVAHYYCLWALDQIHAEPELVVPAFIKALHDP